MSHVKPLGCVAHLPSGISSRFMNVGMFFTSLTSLCMRQIWSYLVIMSASHNIHDMVSYMIEPGTWARAPLWVSYVGRL